MLADNERGYNSKPLHERTGYLNFLLRSSDDTLKGLGAFVGKRLIYGAQTPLVLCLNADHGMNVCLYSFLINVKPCIAIISLKFGSSEGLVNDKSQKVTMQSYM